MSNGHDAARAALLTATHMAKLLKCVADELKEAHTMAQDSNDARAVLKAISIGLNDGVSQFAAYVEQERDLINQQEASAASPETTR